MSLKILTSNLKLAGGEYLPGPVLYFSMPSLLSIYILLFRNRQRK